MPAPLRTANNFKVEAKFNVVTECMRRTIQSSSKCSTFYSVPNFDLHSAAAAGNIGLVEYALSRGQPVNSVLDGVLPLHAACAGGDEQVVRLLIDHGADVNAPRLFYFFFMAPVSYLLPSDYLGNTRLVGRETLRHPS